MDQSTGKLLDRFAFLPPELDCGDGWYQVLFDLCKAIEDTTPPTGFRIIKVFDKYGELKVYSVGGNCATRLCISEAVDLAADVCSGCGGLKEEQKCERCKKDDVGDCAPDISAALPPKVEADGK